MPEEKCLVCLVNPAYRCANCGATLCKTGRNVCTKGVCPDRPLYGGGDGHYYIPIGKRPLYVMPKPLVIKMTPKPKPSGHDDCELC